MVYLGIVVRVLRIVVRRDFLFRHRIEVHRQPIVRLGGGNGIGAVGFVNGCAVRKVEFHTSEYEMNRLALWSLVAEMNLRHGLLEDYRAVCRSQPVVSIRAVLLPITATLASKRVLLPVGSFG